MGNAANFVAASTQYLSAADNATFDMGDIDFTITAWVQLASKPANVMGIASKFTAAGNQRSYQFQWVNTTDRFRVVISPLGTGASNIIVAADNFGAPSLSTWYFVEVRHDAAANTIAISVNNGTPNSGAVTGGAFASTAQFDIGRIDGGSYWNGIIDEVGAWKRKLSDAEITDLYNSGSGRSYAYIAGGTNTPKTVAGTLTTAGSLLRSTGKPLAGTLTSAGSLLRNAGKRVAGTLTSAGAIVRATAKSAAGTLTSSGALATARMVAVAVAGTLTTSGSLMRSTAKSFAGALSTAGELVTETAGELVQAVGGTLAMAGSVTRAAAKSLDGTLLSSGAILRATAKSIAGTLTIAGTLSRLRAIVMSLGGTLSIAGTLTKRTAKSIAGALSFLGSLFSIIPVQPRVDVAISDRAVTLVTLSDAIVYALSLSDHAVTTVTLSDTTRS